MRNLRLGLSDDGQPLEVALPSLSTHGFVLGMTGSGKTGLCVVLIEELLAQGVPVIAVDSKGDLGTLLLNFESTDTASLQRWSPDAAQAAARLEAARASLGLTVEQLRERRSGYQARLYTPGSTLGLPLDVLGSLAAPTPATPEALSESADGITRGLLGLLGLEADPLTSREYLLLVQILTQAWQAGQTPTLVDLVRQVATPPFATVGALPLDDFFPQRDRQALMVRLNGLVASPKFAAWRQGEPLDLNTLTRAPDGKPRLSVYSVAHLSDEERVVAVAQLLERTTGWMRKQGGSGTVRCVVLIDEIFGYFPPAPANPPTKAPLIGLLKQARAFGVSVVLATQNPIDLDYRGLANIGTWLVGRLQTAQDTQRIRDALLTASAQAGITPAELDERIAGLKPRHFLLHSVHRPKPTVFASRDALTLLRGPFSAEEFTALTAPMKTTSTPAASATLSASAKSATAAPLGIDPALGPVFERDMGLARPFIALKFGVRYRVGKLVSEESVHELAFELTTAASPPDALEQPPFDIKGVSLGADVPAGVTLAELPDWALRLTASKWLTALKERLPSKLQTKLMVDEATKLISEPTETAEAFTARVLAKQELSKQGQTLLNKLEKKRADLAQAERDVQSKKAEKWLQVGAGVLSLFSGRRSSVSAASRAMSSHGRQGTAEGKVEDAALEVRQLEEQLAALKEVDTARFVEQLVVPKPADVQVLKVQLAYIVP
jgi:hypothetical protein